MAAHPPPGTVYQHETGAVIMLPPFAASEKVYEHHLVTVRTELDNFGLADPTAFAAKVQKVG